MPSPKINPFKLERYFAKYEFSAPYLLSSSDCDSLTMDELLHMADEECKSLWNNLKLSYTESTGHPLLKEEIAKLYTELNADHVTVLTPEEGIYIAMKTMVEDGDHIIVTYPGYQSLYEVAASTGCEVGKWEPNVSDMTFHVDDLKALIKPNTRLLVMNFPHNPTGATISKDMQLEIVELAKAHNLMIFSDEMYRFLEYDKGDLLPSIAEIYDKGIALCGMSKTYALAGLRIGWLVTKDKELMSNIRTYKDYTTICSSGPSEILALIGLRNGDAIIKRNLDLIASNLTVLDSFIKKYSHLFEWNRPIAGPIAFVKYKGQQDISDFFIDLVEAKGVMLLPASQYDYDGPYFRIGFARFNMPEALGKLEEFINKSQ